jgi:hypothetical protein
MCTEIMPTSPKFSFLGLEVNKFMLMPEKFCFLVTPLDVQDCRASDLLVLTDTFAE